VCFASFFLSFSLSLSVNERSAFHDLDLFPSRVSSFCCLAVLCRERISGFQYSKSLTDTVSGFSIKSCVLYYLMFLRCACCCGLRKRRRLLICEQLWESSSSSSS